MLLDLQKPSVATIYTRVTLNDYRYFTKFELQLQVNNAVCLLGVPSIARIITEIATFG